MSRYSVKVDWLSVVFPCMASGRGAGQDVAGDALTRCLRNEIGEALSDRLFQNVEALDYGRAPYNFGWQDKHNGVTIWSGGEIQNLTVEFSGRGMDYLRESAAETVMISHGQDRASRLDIALDIETDETPQSFVSKRSGGRQQSNAEFNSASGATLYIGSRHSERYCRVYRYAPPHPRSHLLRVEVVLKRSYARAACIRLATTGLEAVARGCLEQFGFSDVIEWGEGVEADTLTVYRPERNGGKTLRWLITQVAPAFQKLVRDGTIPDAEQFIQGYFLNALIEDGTIPS